MSQPLIFVTTHTVKEGRLDDLHELNERFVAFAEQHEPRLLALQSYLSDDGTRLTLVQVHPDTDSLEFHLQVAEDLIRASFELVDNERVALYGAAGAATRGLLDHLAEAGVQVEELPRSLGGFARVATAA
jgi:hypothetical protein